MSAQDVEWNAGLTINTMPLNSAICEPTTGAQLKAGPLTLRGWAAASGRAVRPVDVSLDGARTWHQATLQQNVGEPNAWTLWSLEAGLEKGEHELVVRAFDEAMQTQPDAPDATWNFAATSSRIVTGSSEC